jgi:hypothetical protein
LLSFLPVSSFHPLFSFLFLPPVFSVFFFISLTPYTNNLLLNASLSVGSTIPVPCRRTSALGTKCLPLENRHRQEGTGGAFPWAPGDRSG